MSDVRDCVRVQRDKGNEERERGSGNAIDKGEIMSFFLLLGAPHYIHFIVPSRPKYHKGKWVTMTEKYKRQESKKNSKRGWLAEKLLR